MYHKISIPKIQKYLTRSFKKPGFEFSSTNSVINLYSTCYGVQAASLINYLEQFPVSDLVDFIQSYQVAETGLFIDHQLNAHKGTKRDLEYIELQQTDFAIMALRELGVKPKYKPSFLSHYNDTTKITKWLANLDWSDPWLVSNKIMFVINSLIFAEEDFKISTSDAITAALDWLDKNQDANTGLWHLGSNSHLLNQVAAAYHFLFFYTYTGRRPQYVDKIIDSVLKLQNYDGLFTYAGGGGSCEDLDAIDLLCRCNFYTDHRRDDIVSALQKAYPALIANQRASGGFCWAVRDQFTLSQFTHTISFKYLLTSWKDFKVNAASKLKNQYLVLTNPHKLSWAKDGFEPMRTSLNTADMWSTWFRLAAISMIEITFPDYFPQTTNWNTKQSCGLAYYK